MCKTKDPAIDLLKHTDKSHVEVGSRPTVQDVVRELNDVIKVLKLQ